MYRDVHKYIEMEEVCYKCMLKFRGIQKLCRKSESQSEIGHRGAFPLHMHAKISRNLKKLSEIRIGNGNPFGPVTQAIVDAYAAHVDCDFVAQYLAHLD